MNIKLTALTAPLVFLAASALAHDGDHTMHSASDVVTHVAHSSYHIGVLALVGACFVAGAAAVIIRRRKA